MDIIAPEFYLKVIPVRLSIWWRCRFESCRLSYLENIIPMNNIIKQFLSIGGICLCSFLTSACCYAFEKEDSPSSIKPSSILFSSNLHSAEYYPISLNVNSRVEEFGYECHLGKIELCNVFISHEDENVSNVKLSPKEDIMLPAQLIKKWIPGTQVNTGCFLRLQLKILYPSENGNILIVGEKSDAARDSVDDFDFQRVYVPVSLRLINNGQEVSVCIGEDTLYNEDGTIALEEIYFDASVDDWSDQLLTN